MSKILKSLKRKITVLAVAMIAIQPVLVGGMMMPAETQAAVANFDLTVPVAVTINQSILVPETSGVPTGGNATVNAAVSGLTSIPVTLENTGGAASANVRINPINAGAHIQLWAKDSANNWYDINVTGWGPSGGFSAPIGYNATTDVYAISDVVGSYPLTANLILVSDASPVTHATGTITVVDATAPVIAFHANVTENSTSASGAVVTYTNPTATDNVDPTVIVSCSPASGTEFSVTDTTVTCNATDAAGNAATPTTFTVTVNAALSNVATVTSGTYTVSVGGTSNKTITNVPFGTSKATLLAALTKGQADQTWNDTAITNPVVTGNTLVVTAQDTTTTVTYTVTVNAAVVLSPVVTTVVPAVATVVVPETVPVDEQFGGDASSDQGEVKADTTIKADDQKPSDNNDQNTETKEKKNIPLWGIIFLLVLAGIGGYLFYSQNPETNTKGTKKK